MGSAFAQGFQMGSEMYDSSERMRLAKAAEARADEQFGWLRSEQAKKAEADRLLELASQERGVEGTGSEVGSAVGGLGAYDTSGNQMTSEAREQLGLALDKLSPEQAQQALRAYGSAFGSQNGAIDLSKAGTYRNGAGALMVTDEVKAPNGLDSAKRYEEMAAQAGNMYALKEARANRLAALQISGAQRTEDQAQEFQKLKQDWNQQSAEVHDDINRLMDDNDVDGVLKKYGPLYKSETGNTLVRNGKNILVMKGKEVVDTIPESKFGQVLDQAMGQYYTNGFAKMLVSKGMFNSPSEAISYMTKQQEIANQSRMAGAAEMNAETNRQFHGTGGVYERIQNAHLANQKRQTEGEKYSERISAIADAIQKGEPGTSRGEAEKRAALSIIRDPEARANVLTHEQITNFMDKNQGTVIEVDKKTGKPKRLGDYTLPEQMEITRRFLGGTGGPAGGGLPDPGPMRRPGEKSSGVTIGSPAQSGPQASAPRPAQDKFQKAQAAYDAWQEAKGPWYLPTPRADESEIKRLEQAYLKALQETYK